MDIYSKQKIWKLIVIGLAIIIGISSLLITNNLVKELKSEERKKIELWAAATKQLVSMSMSGEGDYSLATKITTENKNIPVILVDDCDTIRDFRNFDKQTKLNNLLVNIGLQKKKEITKSYLKKELNLIKENGDQPIKININGDIQWIYYKDSALLMSLKYYPIYQLIFIGVFMLIAYITFSASRRSEQNQVWAGMAKETAHQIATPLSSLIAWTELLKQKKGVENIVDEMRKDIIRLETITDRFSKIGSKAELNYENIIKIVNNSIKYLKARMPVNIEFISNYPFDSKILVPISKILFEWVIENVVKNAVDATKGKGTIEISILEKNEKVFINISDNGSGIDRSMIKNIFKPGFTSKKRGWGLGLSLSKRIIEEYHNGRIYVLSSEKNIGTTFTIEIPLSK